MNEAFNFYQRLYNYESFNDKTQEWLLDHLIKKLSTKSKENLEKEFAENEFFDAIKQMQNGKSPGIDGISKEFYQKFWPLIKINS